MKQTTLVLALLLTLVGMTTTAFAQAPSFLWAKSAGGIDYDRGQSIAVDASGNSYVTGYFNSSSITFGSTTLTNAGSGSSDMYVVKYDGSGNVLWAKNAGGTDYDAGYSIAVDSSGNSYVTGYFNSSSITFGSTTLTNNGGYDMCVVKYDGSGNVVWAKNAGGISSDFGYSIAVDVSGNSYVTGSFSSASITFGSTTLMNASSGSNDIYVVKYDGSGNVVWAKRAGGTGNDIGYSFAVDASGNSYATGVFKSSSITFGSTTLTNASSGSNDIYVVKYDGSGNVVWAKSAGGTGYDFGSSITVDASGNSYATGYFASSSITFGSTTLTRSGVYDMYVVKYDGNGNVLWATSAVGVSSSIAVDVSGNSYATGYFNSSRITFGSTTLMNNGNSDMFVAKIGNVIQYTITATAGTNGSITPSGTVNVNQGANQSFTITPNTGYHIDSIFANGAYIGNTSPFSFFNVSANQTIYATFAINTYTLTVTQGANGTISPGTTVINYGGSQAFTITPNTGYHIDSVFADGSYVGNTSPFSFTNVTSNHTITATFAQNAKVTAISPTQNALNVSPSANVQVTFNTALSTSSFNDTTSFIVSGSVSGRHRGSFAFSGGNTVATFNPTTDFKNGEVVTVDISSNVQDAVNTSVQSFVSQFTVATTPSTGTFATKVDIAIGTMLPYSVFVSDLDGDGDGDIVVGNRGPSPGEVSVLKNNGDGTFADKVNYATNDYPSHVFVSDVDGDGDGDIIAAASFSPTVSVLMNNGDGTFAPKVNYNAGGGLSSVFVSDVDGDGYGDIVVTNQADSLVSVLKNNGNGTFATKVSYRTGPQPYSVFVSDVDGDGDGDIVVANNGNYTAPLAYKVSVLKNNGNGTFMSKVDYEVGSSPQSVYVSDVDGDGDGDIVTANYSSFNVSVLKNNGDGTYAPKIDYNTGGSQETAFVSDVDGDGYGDIVVSKRSDKTISVLKNNGNGTFATKVDYAAGDYPEWVFVSDVDGDGDGDVVVTNYNSNTISIFRNLKTYTITANAYGNGNITPSGTVNINEGQNQSFIITPNTGYHIDSIFANGAYIGNTSPFSFFNVSANQTIYATFAINTYTLTVTQGANGTISPGTTVINYGGSQAFTITPNTGYHIDSIIVDGVYVGNTSSFTFSNVTANHTITATFAMNIFTINATASTSGSVTPNGSVTVNYGENQTFTIAPNTGYHILDVLIDGEFSAGAVSEYTFTNVTANHTLVATFAINTYSIIASAGTNGDISPKGIVTVNHGGSQTFTFIPDAGYHVLNVFIEGDISVGAVTEYTFDNITGNHSIHVTFEINTGLVAYYPFNGNANDATVYGNNGTVNGATLTTDRFGNANSAYSFNGTNNFINCGNSITLQLTNAISISAWIKTPGSAKIGEYIIGKAAYGQPSYEYSMEFEFPGPGLKADVGGENYDELTTTFLPSDTNWYHIALTWEYPGLFKLYKNGELLNSMTTTGVIEPTAQEMAIGCIRPRLDEVAARYFEGTIDDIRIYNYAITELDIENLYNEGGYATASISGKKFLDANLNHQYDAGESGIPNWKIYLASGNLFDSTETDSLGNYSFTNLIAGTYYVKEENVPGWLQMYPQFPEFYTLQVASGATLTNIDFGNFRRGVIVISPPPDTTITWNDTSIWGGNTLPGPNDTIQLPPHINIVINTDSLPSGNDSLGTIIIPDSTVVIIAGDDTLHILGSLEIEGDVEIDTTENPAIEIEGDFSVSGNFQPGKSHVKMHGHKKKHVGKKKSGGGGKTNGFPSLFAAGDSTTFYNLTINGDSTITSGKIIVQNNLTLNATLTVGNRSTNKTEETADTIVILNNDTNAVSGSGEIYNGTLKRKLRQGQTGIYRFHSLTTSIQLSGNGTNPASISFTKHPTLSNISAGTYLAFKGGTVDTAQNVVRVGNIKTYSRWAFGQVGHKQGDSTGGPLYDVAAEEAAPEKSFGSSPTDFSPATVSLNYNPSMLKGIPEPQLGLLKSASALKIKSYSDADGNNASTDDRTSKRWSVSLYTTSVSQGNFLSTETDSVVEFEDAGTGTFIVVAADSDDWRTIQRVVNTTTTNDSVQRVTLSLQEGRIDSVTFVNYQIPDTVYFRTFAPDVNLAAKAVKMKFIKGIVNGKEGKVLKENPNIATALENVFINLGKNGATFLGIEQLLKDSAKKYGWVTFKKGSDLGKMYTQSHDGKSYPIDSLRIPGKKSKKLSKTVKPKRDTYNNLIWEQGICFKLNLLASQTSVTEPGFGGLMLDTSFQLTGRGELKGETLDDIGKILDTAMTYYKKYGIDSVDEFTNLDNFAFVLRKINNGFAASLSSSNYEIDTNGVVLGTNQPSGKKNVYAMRLLGVKTAREVGVVKYSSKSNSAFFVPQSNVNEQIPMYELHQNYPNPFNPSTAISFQLSAVSEVTLKIYNVLGQEVATLIHSREMDEGMHEVQFDASGLTSGVYFYRLQAEEFSATKKLLLMK